MRCDIQRSTSSPQKSPSVKSHNTRSASTVRKSIEKIHSPLSPLYIDVAVVIKIYGCVRGELGVYQSIDRSIETLHSIRYPASHQK